MRQPAHAAEVRIATLRLEIGDGHERPDVRQDVDHRVEEHRLDARRVRRNHRRHHVPRLRNRGVGEHPLDVCLTERHDVASNHGDTRKRRHQMRPVRRERRECDEEHAQEDRHPRRLRAHGEECRHGRRCALIHIGSPEMERDDRELEEEAREDKDYADEPEGKHEAKALCDPLKHHRPRHPVDEAHAVEEHCRRARPEHQILDARLCRERRIRADRNECIERDRHKLQPDKRRHEVVCRGASAHAKQGGQEEQIELAPVADHLLHIVLCEKHGGENTDDKENLEEDGIAVNDVEPR